MIKRVNRLESAPVTVECAPPRVQSAPVQDESTPVPAVENYSNLRNS